MQQTTWLLRSWICVTSRSCKGWITQHISGLLFRYVWTGRKKTWVIMATSSGSLSLWDLHFGLSLKTCSVGGGNGLPVHLRQCLLHPSKSHWVMVAIDASPQAVPEEIRKFLIKVWDVKREVSVEYFIFRETGQVRSGQVSTIFGDPNLTWLIFMRKCWMGLTLENT